MPTRNERKGLWFLALVAMSGTGVRVWRSHAPEPPPTESRALERQIERIDSTRTAQNAKRAARDSARKAAPRAKSPQPTAVGPIDLNVADAAAIEALPGIGPALAARIVAHRDSAGAFAGMTALCEVRGIGRAMAERLRPLVTFSGVPSPVSDACGEASRQPRKTPAARSQEPS